MGARGGKEEPGTRSEQLLLPPPGCSRLSQCPRSPQSMDPSSGMLLPVPKAGAETNHLLPQNPKDFNPKVSPCHGPTLKSQPQPNGEPTGKVPAPLGTGNGYGGWGSGPVPELAINPCRKSGCSGSARPAPAPRCLLGSQPGMGWFGTGKG